MGWMSQLGRKTACLFSHQDALVSRETTSSMTASARSSISAGVRSWIGCGTNTASRSGRPRRLACTLAAVRNSDVAKGTEGIPFSSSRTLSCKLHVVQEPQSANASITPSTNASLSSRTPEAGFV